MKTVILSDTHNQHQKVEIPECDLLIHTGDATNSSTLVELKSFAEWFKVQPARYKIFIPGNHDWAVSSSQYYLFKEWVGPGVHVPICDYLEIEGLSIFGCGNENQIDRCPVGVDILLCHYPCNGILDKIPPNSLFNNNPFPLHLGSTKILQRVLQDIKPKCYLHGHIHPSYGTFNYKGTTFINAALCNDEYQLVNKPIELEISNANSNNFTNS